MMWLRRIILGLPLILLVFFACAFVAVRQSAPKKLNQYVFGTAGEPDTCNPILSTTSVASEIESRVFNGLIRFNEKMEIEGELARSWVFGQTSVLYYAHQTQAANALKRLQAHRAEWAAIKLSAATVENQSLRLGFSAAGTGYRERLLKWVGEPAPLPVTFVSVQLDTKKKFDNGAQVAAQTAVEQIRGRLAKTPGLAGRVIYYWHFGSSAYVEIAVIGEPTEIVSAIKDLLHADAKDKALGTCEKGVSSVARDEPLITFMLRQGVRWHDGHPFTSADVLFTYEALMDEKVASPRRSSYELIRQVEAPDEVTVRVTYKRPYSPALLSWMMDVLPAHLLKGKDTRWWANNFNRTPVGTGPYKFEKWETNQLIAMRKNADYWEGAPHLDRVVMRFIPDVFGLRLSFETGEIDVLGVQPHALGSVRQNPGYRIMSDLGKMYVYVGWNLERPMFQDKRVRQALAHAVNVPDIIQYVLYGQGVQCKGVYHPDYFWAKNDVRPIEYNPARAKELLAEAGWTQTDEEGYLVKDGKRFAFTIITNQGNEVRKDIATLVQGDLKKLGIDVKVAIYEWAVFITKKIDVHEFDACVLGWTSPPNFDQYQLWHSSQSVPGGLNFVSYANPEVDRLIEIARSEFDPGRIKEYCHKIQQIIYDDQPYLFLYVPMSTAALHRNRFRVRRPDGQGDWIDEDIRKTKAGYSIYNTWWYRPEHMQETAPGRVP